jgi:hypothetical protein
VSKLINLEVVTIDSDEGYVMLEAEDGLKFEMPVELLPDHLREGRFLRFVVSHTDYNIDEMYESNNLNNSKGIPDIPKGHKLTW